MSGLSACRTTIDSIHHSNWKEENSGKEGTEGKIRNRGKWTIDGKDNGQITEEVLAILLVPVIAFVR